MAVEHVDIGHGPNESVVLSDDEAAEAIQLARPRKLPVKGFQEALPRLVEALSRHEQGRRRRGS